MDELPYYVKLGWMTPTELTYAALEANEIDNGLASLLSALGMIRVSNSPELEIKFMRDIELFLRAHVPDYDKLVKQAGAGWN